MISLSYQCVTYSKVKLFNLAAEVDQQCRAQVRVQWCELTLAQISVPQSNTST